MLRMLETSDVRRETEVRRPAARVVNRSCLWLRDDPLVPAVLTVTHPDTDSSWSYQTLLLLTFLQKWSVSLSPSCSWRGFSRGMKTGKMEEMLPI